MRRARPPGLVPGERARSQGDAGTAYAPPALSRPTGMCCAITTLMQLNTLCVKKASRQCFTTDAQR